MKIHQIRGLVFSIFLVYFALITYFIFSKNIHNIDAKAEYSSEPKPIIITTMEFYDESTTPSLTSI